MGITGSQGHGVQGPSAYAHLIDCHSHIQAHERDNHQGQDLLARAPAMSPATSTDLTMLSPQLMFL